MIRSAVTRLAPFLLLAAASCGTGPGPEQAPKPSESSGVAKTTPASPPKPAPPASAVARTGQVTRIPLGTLFQYHQEGRVLIFDVRPSFVYRLGHIPGAVSWPKSDFQNRLAENESRIQAARTEGKPVVIYCVDLACPDARIVASLLAERGHSVSVLEGGYDAWKTGSLPTE